MLDAAFKALAQMFTRPFRTVLWKSIGLAAVLIIVVGIGLNRVLVWLAGVAQGWAEQTLGFTTNMPVSVLAWLLSFAATVGIVAGSVLLMPAVTALVGSLFVDEIGAEVERTHYPDEPAGQDLPLWRALYEGTKTALLAVVVYLAALPFWTFWDTATISYRTSASGCFCSKPSIGTASGPALSATAFFRAVGSTCT